MRISKQKEKARLCAFSFCFLSWVEYQAKPEISFKKILHLCSNAGSYLSYGQDNFQALDKLKRRFMKKNDFRQLRCFRRLLAPIRRIFLVFVFGVTLLPGTGQVQPRFISNIGDTEASYCLASSPDGKNVYAGGLYTIVVFARHADGSLVTRQVLNNDHQGVAQIGRIMDIVVTSDGRFVYAVRGADQTLLLFSRDSTTGEILLKDAIKDSAFFSRYGDVPVVERNYRLLISPDGAHLFWLYSPLWHYPDNRLAVFRRNTQTGYLDRIQIIKNGDAELDGLNVTSSLAFSPDGNFLYGAGHNDDKLLAFSRDSGSGLISLDNAYETRVSSTFGWFQSAVLVTPDGESVYAANFSAGWFIIFNRNLEDGRLTLSDIIQQPGPRVILSSSQSDHIYLGRNGEIATFNRDLQTGQLNLAQVIAGGFRDPAGLTISPDDKTLYKTTDTEVTSIQKDSVSGKLTLFQQLDNNLGGTDRLGRSRSVETSPDGRFLYVAARFEDAGISTFARDQEQGTLTLTRSDSLPDVSAMIMAPDGRHLYVSSVSENTITNLAIDPSTGALRLVQTLQDTFDQKRI